MLTLQFRLYLLQIVGALGLSAGGQGLLLGAHILDLGQLQCAILLGLGQRVPGNVGMDMDLEGLVVLADDQAVPNSVQEGPQRSQIHVRSAFAHNIDRVEGKGGILGVKIRKIRLFLSGRLCHVLRLRQFLAHQAGEHSPQDDQETFAAGVHHARFFQNGILVDGIRQGLLPPGNGISYYAKIGRA